MGCHFLLQGIFPTQIELESPALEGKFFTPEQLESLIYNTESTILTVFKVYSPMALSTFTLLAHQGLIFKSLADGFIPG